MSLQIILIITQTISVVVIGFLIAALVFYSETLKQLKSLREIDKSYISFLVRHSNRYREQLKHNIEKLEKIQEDLDFIQKGN